MTNNRPWSEQFKETADAWVDAEAAASLLEETKSAIMAQKQTALGDMPVNRAEQTVKASPDWYEHLTRIVDARKKANQLKVEVEYIKMKSREQENQDANHRAEMRL